MGEYAEMEIERQMREYAEEQMGKDPAPARTAFANKDLQAFARDMGLRLSAPSPHHLQVGLEDTENTINREASERGWVIWDGNAPRCGWPKNARPIDYVHLYAAAPNPATLCKRLPWVWPLPNVWLGVSVEDQRAADKRIPLLLQAPAVVRFISAEPLLGALELGALMGVPAGAEGEGADYYNALRGFGFFSDGEPAASRGERLDWVITGGESGPGARPMDPSWARSLRDQCEEAGVPFFFKQWGGPNKKKAGRVLDGRTHDAMPEVRRAA